MSKQFLFIPAMVAALCLLVSPSVIAQSKDDGDRLLQEGLEIQGKARSKEDLEKALKKYEEALSIFRKTGDGINEGQTLKNLGNAYSSLRDSDKAAAYYEEALKIAVEIGHKPTEGQVLNNLGNIYKDRRQYSKAVEYYEKSLVITKKIGDIRVQSLTCNNLGKLYSNTGQHDKAVEYYEQALAITREFKDRRSEGRALRNLGIVYSDWNRWDKAVHYYEQALSIKRELKDRSGEQVILNDLGMVYGDWSQYDRAAEYYEKSVEYYEKSLVICRELKDETGEGQTSNNLGAVYDRRGQYDKAIEYYEKALEIKRNTGDLEGEGQTLRNLGIAYRKWGQPAKAIEFFEKSLEIVKKVGAEESEINALNSLGIAYAEAGQHTKAVEYFEQALKVARETGHIKNEGEILNRLGEVSRRGSKYAKAVEYYGKALETARKIGNLKGEGEILNNIGLVYDFWSQYSTAAEYYEKSLKIWRNLGDVKDEGQTLNNLGIVYKALGQYSKAVEYYEKALEVARKTGDVDGEGAALGNLGLAYEEMGQYSKATKYYEGSFAIAKKIGSVRSEGLTLHNLGGVYYNLGQYSKAEEYFEKSLEIKRKIGDIEHEGSTLNGLGSTHFQWGQYDKAMDYYEKALDICRKIGDVRGQGSTLINLGEVYAYRTEYDDAITNFTKAMVIYQGIGVPTWWPKCLIGNVYLDKGEVEKAESFLKEADYRPSLGRLQLIKQDFQGAVELYEKLRQSAEKNRNVDSLFTAYTGLGTAYEGLGDDKRAEEYYLKAVNLTEELRSSLPKAQRETFFDVRINGFLRTAPYDGLARVRIRMNRPIEAFKDSEYTKSRIFAEAMSKWSESTSFDIPQNILTKDRELNDQLAALKKKRQEGYEKANQEVIAVIEPQVQELEKKFQAHVKMLREKYPLFAATKYPEPMGLDQTSLNNGEWVLAYHVTDPGIIIYLTKGKEIVKALFKPIPREKLDNLVLTFRKPLEMVPGKDNFDEKLKSFDLVAGKKLSDLLLSDVLESLPTHVPLLIVPDDSLGMLPFEMLVLNDTGVIKTDKDLPYVSGAEFFGDRNLISYSQSVTALTLSRIHAKTKAKEAGLLAIADPVFHEKDDRMAKAPKQEAPAGVMALLYKRLNLMAAENDPQMGGLRFQRLSMTGELAKTLAELGKKNAKVCTGFEATKDNFLKKISPSLNQYDEVVFATHGYFGKDLPGIMEPVLVLTLVPPGTDGFLRMTEVMGLNMNADIVALTACQTGLGKRTAGEGTMGMGRAFQYAGARSVLMSLWSVSEVASVNLVKSFFRNLKEGKSKSEALASARDEIRKKGFDHPFFWAGFILVGEMN